MLTIFLLIILLSDLIDLHHWWWIYLLEYSSQGHDISHFSSHTAAEMNYQDTRPLIDVGQAIISTWQLLYRRSSEKVYTIFLVASLFKWFSEKQCDKPKWYYCKVISMSRDSTQPKLGLRLVTGAISPMARNLVPPMSALIVAAISSCHQGKGKTQRGAPATTTKPLAAVARGSPRTSWSTSKLWGIDLRKKTLLQKGWLLAASLRSMSLSVLQNNVLHAKHICRSGLLRVVTRSWDASWIMSDPMRFHSALDI